MKKLLIALLGIVVLLLLVVWVGPSLIDLRPRVASAVRDATGRELRIDGSLHVSLLPRLSIAASGVHLSNAPGAATPEMLSVDSFVLQAELWPLISKRLVIDSLEITHPVANLEVDRSGRANWIFASESKPATAPAQESPAAAGGSALGAVQIRAFKLDQGQLSYHNAATGQAIEAKDVTLNAAMSATESPLTLQGQMVLNSEPVAVNLSIDSPDKLSRGEQAKVDLALDTKRVTAKFGGIAQQRPVPGLNGVFDLDIPSVAQLATWLDEPLDKAQPDPGALKIHADFATEGSKSSLREATIVGTGLNAKASGSIDASGGTTKITAALDSDVLDFDRYLPPRMRGNTVPQPTTAAPTAAPTPSPAPPRDLFASLSDQPFDLSALRKLDADVKVSIAGIKAMGYEIGRIAFAATAKGGVFNADLSQLALYSGEITGHAKLDGAGDGLAIDTSVKADHVTLDRLIRQAMAGTPAVTGPVTAAFNATAQGKNPRALVEDLRGHLAVDLSAATIKAGAQAISQLKMDVDLPGGGKAPNFQASGVYNGERVAATASLAPLATIAAGERFPAKLAIDSALVTAHYDGAVQQRPLPGLDGTFDVDTPSVAKLAAWVGKPLEAKQPDPGPLKLHAVFASDGAKIALKDASISGKAIDATAQAAFDGSAKPATFDARVEVKQADLNAYLPPAEEKQAAAKPAPQQSQTSGWSTEPFDLSPLGAANGKAELVLAAVRYRDLDIAKGDVKLTLADRVLKFGIEKLALAQGTVDGLTTLDASGGTAQLNEYIAIAGVQARPLLQTFAGSDRLGGAIEFETTVKGSGKNQKELISSLDGSGHFKVTDGAIYGINLAQALRKVGTLGFGASQTEKTDFAELSGSYTIKAGVIDNRDMKMLAPVIRLTGSGTVPMPPQTVDYAVEAKLVASLQGQGGTDALAGLPIPIKITGPWSNPSYQVDWSSVFKTMAADPARLKSLPGDLSNAAKNFGVSLPSLPASGNVGGGNLPGEIAKPLPGMPQSLMPSAPAAAPAQAPQNGLALPQAPSGLFGK